VGRPWGLFLGGVHDVFLGGVHDVSHSNLLQCTTPTECVHPFLVQQQHSAVPCSKAALVRVPACWLLVLIPNKQSRQTSDCLGELAKRAAVACRWALCKVTVQYLFIVATVF
jgi:hypothetical protein